MLPVNAIEWDEAACLHAGGPSGRWGNLGLWPPAHAVHYAHAAEALAHRVGEAAGLRPGDRVLSVACGRGEELRLWTDSFGADEVVGLEPDTAAAGEAAGMATVGTASARIRVLARGLIGVAVQGTPFDRVVCVDAAYHLSPRLAFMGAALAALRPGGTLAYTDLVRDATTAADPGWPPGLRTLGRRHGLDLDEIVTVEVTSARLHAQGAVDVTAERLDDAVLGGFERFVAQQSRALGWRRLHPAWWRVAGTAALLPRLRRSGLGYALFTARVPANRALAVDTRPGR